MVQTNFLAEEGNAMRDQTPACVAPGVQVHAVQSDFSQAILVVLQGQGRVEMPANLVGASSQRHSRGDVNIQVLM